MDSSGLRRSLDHAKGLSSHALTGTMWQVAKPAFIEGATLTSGGYLIEAFLPAPPLTRLALLLAFFAFGSFWTTKRHKVNHLEHSAIVTAIVLMSTLIVLLSRGYGVTASSAIMLATFSALFFGYRRAF